MVAADFGDVPTSKKRLIKSYGLVVFTRKASELHFLVQKRKHTYQYIDFFSGKWSTPQEIDKLVSHMTESERQSLIREDWSELARRLPSGRMDLSILHLLFRDYTLLQAFQPIQRKARTWEFPKGRRGSFEGEFEAAMREFQEETGIRCADLRLMDVAPLVEKYLGTDGNTYKNVYFLMERKGSIKTMTIKPPACEISIASWCTTKKCMELLDEGKCEVLARCLQHISVLAA